MLTWNVDLSWPGGWGQQGSLESLAPSLLLSQGMDMVKHLHMSRACLRRKRQQAAVREERRTRQPAAACSAVLYRLPSVYSNYQQGEQLHPDQTLGQAGGRRARHQPDLNHQYLVNISYISIF